MNPSGIAPHSRCIIYVCQQVGIKEQLATINIDILSTYFHHVERQMERETETQTETEGHSQTERQTERQPDRQTETFIAKTIST